MAFYGFFTRAADFSGGVDNLTVTYHDPDYTDRAVQFTNERAGAVSWGTALTDVWIHWRQYFTGTHNINADGYWWTILDGNGQSLARADISDGETAYGVFDGNGGSTYSSYISSPGIGIQTDVDIHIQVNSGGNNIITAYHNGVQVATASEPWIDSTGAFNMILNVYDIGQGGGDRLYISEMMVADEDTRGLRLATLTPDAVGGETDFSGAFSDIIERNNGLGIKSGTAAERSSFNITAYGGPASPTAVRGVFTQSWASKGTTGPQSIDPFIRISSVNYDAGNVSPDYSVPVIGEWATNPNTAVDWVAADFASLEIGVESVA